ncbi:MAG: RagB/SusD family nutrient uptake outer membrane protein [Muribaculaceae bacterium]|nr:RagB/SusD family nutrient uptake outer membrane protein [Muribaculaceae bacterium]MDE6643537.1 RagB/SusD family nutrient uptake outer membrane protein [Muribaculaceae bacterium]
MKKYIILSAVALGMSLASCDEVLDRPQLNTPTDESFWNNEIELRLYANSFYTTYFVGYNSGWTSTYTPVRGLTFADDFSTTGQQSNFTSNVPSSLSSTAGTGSLTQTAGQTWDFSMVRKANIMLDRLENGMKDKISEEAFNHWKSVGEFFKAFEYTLLVTSFGDVPYFEHEVGQTDIEELYRDRDPRNFVMGKVYDLCKDVMANMRVNDGANVLNRYVAAGFISRWMLFEGTWQKYHYGNTELADKYLQFAVEAGDYVINSGKFAIQTPMPELFGSYDLSGNKECLIYRKYSDAQAVRHCIASYCNGKEAPPATVNLAFLKSIICVDGKPYKTSSVADADSFKLGKLAVTRDPRFEACFSDKANINSGTRIYGRKFIDRYAWTRPAKDTNPLYESVTNVNDAPVMRYGEVLLNWIEAKAELGNVTQADIDKSINALRARPIDETAKNKGVTQTAPMVLAEIDASFDPDRDADVDPLLWEIRRERRLELVFEYSRLVDIRRWKKLDYMDNNKNPDTMLGPWIDFNEELNTSLTKGSTKVQKADGTVVTYDGGNAADMIGFYVPINIKPRSAFSERSYLYPVGNTQIQQYAEVGKKLTQTTGWE